MADSTEEEQNKAGTLNAMRSKAARAAIATQESPVRRDELFDPEGGEGVGESQILPKHELFDPEGGEGVGESMQPPAAGLFDPPSLELTKDPGLFTTTDGRRFREVID